MHGAQSGDTDFYYECAQIEVTDGGQGRAGSMVKVPGLYDSNYPALRFFIYGAKSYPYTAHCVDWWQVASVEAKTGSL
jgi:hypothetical protein